MNKFIVIGFLLVIGITITYMMTKPKEKPLPVINPVNLEEEMVDPDLLMERKGYGHTIGDFSFTDQNGKAITQNDVKGHVYVAEYFFTTCGSICPVMNEQMTRVHEAYKDEDEFEILSFTVDPEVDNVERMKAYAEQHNADADQWHFLTGEKEKLYELARKSFFVLKPAEAENKNSPDVKFDFIHTNNFVLVDRKMRIRGYYDGTSTSSVDSLIHDVSRLLKEN